MRLDGTASVSGIGSQNGTLSAPMGSSKHTYVRASQAETDQSTALPQKIYLLLYDATYFEHNGDESDIRLPSQIANRTYSTLIKEHPQGVLGIFRSKTRAMIEGKIWLYNELCRISDYLELPLPHEKEDNEFNDELNPPMPGTWRRSGWTANGSYWIMDKGKSCASSEEESVEVALRVDVEERVLNQIDDGAEYVTDEEPLGEEDEVDDEMDSEGESEDHDEAEEPEEGRIAAGIAGTQAPAA